MHLFAAKKGETDRRGRVNALHATAPVETPFDARLDGAASNNIREMWWLETGICPCRHILAARRGGGPDFLVRWRAFLLGLWSSPPRSCCGDDSKSPTGLWAGICCRRQLRRAVAVQLMRRGQNTRCIQQACGKFVVTADFGFASLNYGGSPALTLRTTCQHGFPLDQSPSPRHRERPAST